MKKFVAALAGALSIAVVASAANAAPMGAPMGVAAEPSSSTASSSVVPVHGWHITCQRDRYGWHRSRVWGREKCAPKRWKWKW